MRQIKTLVAGMGRMGQLHAQALADLQGSQLVGLCSPNIERGNIHKRYANVPLFRDYEEALAVSQPDLVCVSTPTRFHAQYALNALEQGAHVFVEKPLADNLEDAEKVFERANKLQRKVLVGHILRFHPLWQIFIDEAKKLGSPLVMRFSLNQQSDSELWSVQKKLLRDTTALLDGGVHYVDVMQQMVSSRVVEMNRCHVPLASGAFGTKPNYSHIQIGFADGSLGVFEAGWGPMISRHGESIRDVTGPLGSVSLESDHRGEYLVCHRASLNDDGCFREPDKRIECPDNSDIHSLCRSQLQYFIDCIRQDRGMQEHYQAVLAGLSVVV
ncbi:MAG: Gfo/Idh/MocA family oxidoreductase [Porticoccaceae bacterium]|nr:Gfo/Idh/MocA family oxidoreductase [Porticoccaceae bacterium]